MCGIAGEFSLNRVPDPLLVKEMARRLQHRGSDDSGFYKDDSICLAHQRLSIIDLSKDGHQPMFNEMKNLVLVFNGEIYNYKSLRERLEDVGHVFKSETDSEVIVHAYESWGITRTLHELDGMFAFALWNSWEKRLYCARDRFGIKPFYYTVQDGSFIFASEIKALLAHPYIGMQPEDETVNEFLKSGVLDYSHKTMFKDIYQIRPAQSIEVSRNIRTESGFKTYPMKHGGFIQAYRYWATKVNHRQTGVINDNYIAKNVRALLEQAVETHLQSDVPVGSCLSGGMDSATIVEIIRKTHKNQSTFSAYFSDPRFDEREYIETVLKGTDITPYYVQPTLTPEDIDKVVYIQDEPFGSLSILAQYHVMRSASQHVKVLLDGQGADELLAGYLVYQSTHIRGLIKNGEYGLALRELRGSIRNHADFIKYAARQLFARRNASKIFTNPSEGICRFKGSLSEVLYNELMKTNLQALLHYEDRNSMAFSIETRVPYLDTRLVNYLVSLPYDQKIRDGVTKYCLRNAIAIEGLVPDKIRNRQDKMGFVTPEEVIMKTDLKEFAADILSSDSFKSRSYWYAADVFDLFTKYCAGKAEYTPEIWRCISTELWLRKFFDNRESLNNMVITNV